MMDRLASIGLLLNPLTRSQRHSVSRVISGIVMALTLGPPASESLLFTTH